jgi:hypothetical protein
LRTRDGSQAGSLKIPGNITLHWNSRPNSLIYVGRRNQDIQAIHVRLTILASHVVSS